MTEEAAGRIIWLDLLRIVAVLAVIVLHVAAFPVTQFSALPRQAWWWANAYDSLVRFCIPLFVMLSGALLLTQTQWDAARFFRRRFIRVALPFVAWSLLYALWSQAAHDKPVPPAEFLRHLLAGMADPVYSHLWYLPLILSLYLLVPILRVYALNAPARNQLYFLCLWLAATAVRPVVEQRAGLTVGYYLDPVVGYVGYFLAGALLFGNLPERVRRSWLLLCGGVFAAGYALTVWGTYILTLRNNGVLDEYFYSHFSPGVIAMSIAAFILLRHVGIRMQTRLAGSPASRWVALAGMASLGVYLVHMMIFDLLSYGMLGFVLGPLSFNPAFAIPSTAAAVFLLSLGAAALLRLTPATRWLAP